MSFQELLKAERHRIAEEDRIEMDRFRDKLRRQEIDGNHSYAFNTNNLRLVAI